MSERLPVVQRAKYAAFLRGLSEVMLRVEMLDFDLLQITQDEMPPARHELETTRMLMVVGSNLLRNIYDRVNAAMEQLPDPSGSVPIPQMGQDG